MTDELPPDLSHAGAGVDQAIAHMVNEGLDAGAIASALLGGAMTMLRRAMPDIDAARVLERAVAGLRRGELD